MNSPEDNSSRAPKPSNKTRRKLQKYTPAQENKTGLLNRRNFLFTLGAAATAATIGYVAKNQLGDSNPEVSNQPENYKKRAIQEISLLPESGIKKALQARVVPLLQETTPFSTKLSGVDILLESVTVNDSTLRTNGPMGIDGTYTSRKNLSTTIYKPVNSIDTLVPLIGIIRPGEISKFPAGYLLPDGTPTVKFHWDQNSGGIDKSFSPAIDINISWDGKPNTVQAEQALRSWGYIKESCSFLLDILMLEATIAKMQQFGIKTNYDVKDPVGNVVNIPVVPEARIFLIGQKGRSMAIMDLAGYMVSLKAFSKTSTLQQLIELGTVNRDILPSIEVTSLGISEGDILLKSFEWVLSMSDPKVFSHDGNLESIP